MARQTKSDYLALMQHAIHADAPASGVSLSTVLAQAGQRLFDAKPWPWRRSDPVTLTMVQGTEEIDIPATDCGRITSCVCKDNILQRIAFVSYDVLQRLRNNQTVASALIYYVCFQPWSDQTTTTADPTPRLLLDRTVLVTGTPTFEITYEKDFLPMAADADVPNMPPSMDLALNYLCRAMAWSMENDGEHPDMARAEKEIELQWEKWRTAQPNLGPIRGGAGDRLPRRYTSADLARFRL